jgi:hypothetical protein
MSEFVVPQEDRYSEIDYNERKVLRLAERTVEVYSYRVHRMGEATDERGAIFSVHQHAVYLTLWRVFEAMKMNYRVKIDDHLHDHQREWSIQITPADDPYGYAKRTLRNYLIHELENPFRSRLKSVETKPLKRALELDEN